MSASRAVFLQYRLYLEGRCDYLLWYLPALEKAGLASHISQMSCITMFFVTWGESIFG